MEYLFGCTHVHKSIRLVQLREGVLSGERIGGSSWDDFVDKSGAVVACHFAEGNDGTNIYPLLSVKGARTML